MFVGFWTISKVFSLVSTTVVHPEFHLSALLKATLTDLDSALFVFLSVTYEAMVDDSGGLMGDLVLGGTMPTG